MGGRYKAGFKVLYAAGLVLGIVSHNIRLFLVIQSFSLHCHYFFNSVCPRPGHGEPGLRGPGIAILKTEALVGLRKIK